MELVKKIGKKLGKVLLIIILLLLVLAGLAIYHRIHMAQSKKLLQEMGYCNPVSVGDHS